MRSASFGGVIPAHVLPFNADLEIDEDSLRRHLSQLVSVEGVEGVVTNAHASEVATLSEAEQLRVLEVALDVCRDRVPVISGVYGDENRQAARLAAQFEATGADGLLIFPPTQFQGGSQMRPEMALARYSDIASATSLPMIMFVYPASTGMQIETDAVVGICESVPNLAAVKEWSNDIVVYERNYRAIKQLQRPVALLSSFSRSLLASLCVGSDGILSGNGSVIAAEQVQIRQAVEGNDLSLARELWQRIRPFVELCYRDPFLDGHSRMKVALSALGVMRNAYVRPPLQPISEFEIRLISECLDRTDLVVSRDSSCSSRFVPEMRNRADGKMKSRIT